jgi:hypothetical protein
MLLRHRPKTAGIAGAFQVIVENAGLERRFRAV